jgi:hypothetical protein
MSKPKPKPSKKPSARALQPIASTRGARRDEPDESEPDLTELVDEALLSFVMTPALGSTNLLVLALSPTGDAVIQDRQVAEARRIPEQLAISIEQACERHAEAERRACRFKAAWMRGDKTLATYAWECGSSQRQQVDLDGSALSFLQQQQLFAQAQHKLHLEGFEMVQEGWAKLLQLQNKRIEALERDNAELRDRLRKLDDVGSELAIEQMRVETEQRGRTADLLEKRVLPIVQAFAVKQLQTDSATPTHGGKHEQSDNENASA